MQDLLEELHVDADTYRPKWYAGDTMDYVMAVEGLWYRDSSIPETWR